MDRIVMWLKRKIEGTIEVEEVLDVIEVGTTIPVRCRLQNVMNVVVKYMKNPFGQRVLINELIGSCIADIIGLKIPKYGICNLSEDVISNTNENEDIDERNAGLAFYTKDYSSTIPPGIGMLSLVENKDTEKIILFDHIVNNCDRHMGNLLLDIKEKVTLYVIDNSHIITEGIGTVISQELENDSIFSKKTLEKNKKIYDNLSIGMGYSEEKLTLEAQKMKESITDEVLAEIKSLIPSVWIAHVGQENVDIIFEVIRRRSNAMDDLSKMIIEERRK